MFPNLRERLSSQGTKLSGGEQQMLAIGRILRTGADLLLLDEPTEGLAPVIVQQIGRTIAELKREGFTIVLVEQNFHFAASVADRHYVVETGRVVRHDPERGARRQPRQAASLPRGVMLPYLVQFGGTKVKLGILALASAASLLLASAAMAVDVKIGVLNDRSGVYADLSGEGSVIAARMAVEDFDAAAKGINVEIVSADHQNKPDVASNIARQWYDQDGVDIIVDVPTSSAALAVNEITREKNKIFLVSGPRPPI